MSTVRDQATRDLLHTRVRLRKDIQFRPEHSGPNVWYQVECRERARFFRMGQAEYTFVSQLDGHTTPAEAISLTSRVLGADAFTEEQATSILTWLIQNELASCESGLAAFRNSPRQRGGLLSRLNPFWMKLPLGNPDPIIARITHWLGWLFSWPAMLAMCGTWFMAGLLAAGHWSELIRSSGTILAPENWIWLFATWLVLKLVHEAGHAVACRSQGGTVRETGIILILLAPMAYVDVTSSLRFRSRWQRIQTAAAGMMIEITIAALAILAWTQIHSDVIRHQLCNIAFMASVSTLVFNANPLMKFDGYFILSDLLELPNLYSRGSDALRALTLRVLIGRRQNSIAETPVRTWIILLYGVLAFAWRMLVCVSLLIAASVLFHGLGVVLVGLGITLWVLVPLGRLGIAVLRGIQQAPTASVRRILRAGSLITAALAALLFLPWPVSRSAPGIVEYEDLAVVRAGSPGFIRTIHVSDGEQVAQGQVLFNMENPDLEAELSDLRAALSQSELKYLKHVREQNAAAAQIEAENRNALRKRHAEKERQWNALTVTAPVSGRVMSRSLAWMPDTYAEEGEELLSIGDEVRKEFRVSVMPEDAEQLHAGDALAVRVRGCPPVTGHVRQVTSHASSVPEYEALTVPAGGPLTVRPRMDQTTDAESQFELTSPRISVVVRLPETESLSTAAGSLGHIRIQGARYPSLGTGLYYELRSSITAQIAAATAASRQ